MEKSKKIEKVKEELSDQFLTEVVSILGLPKNFRFTNETMGSVVDISDNQIEKIKELCVENEKNRIEYNKKDDRVVTMNSKWSYEVIENYFNKKLN